MGFLDNLGEKVGKSIKEASEKYNHTSERVDKNTHGMSDKTLIRKYKEESDVVKKIAMGNELKKRGYGNKN